MKLHVKVFATIFTVLVFPGIGLGLAQPSTATAVPESPEHSETEHMDSISTADDRCDVQLFVLQQQAYATALGAFEQAYLADPEAALRTVYFVGETYRTFALNCGFIPPEEAEHGHEEGESETEPDHSDAAHLALAQSIGDSENGSNLFTTVEPQTGFACATCHRVDSTETLIGPGLINIADPAHDPAQHEHGEDASTSTTDTAHTERTMEEVIEYIRTSILHPSEFVVPGFPDNLMPQIYGQILSEQEINDLVAYLLTLP